MLSLPGTGALRAPVHVDLNITNGCDLHCTHCHSSSGERAVGELSIDELLAIGREVYAMGATSLLVAGGEPFVRHGVVDLLAELSALPGWSVGVVTNGQALASHRAAARLAAACPDLLVNVSLDGHTPELNGVLRRKRSVSEDDLFAQTCQAVTNLADLGLAVSINTTVTRRTIDHLPAMCALADELGAIGVVAIKFLPVGFGGDTAAELDLDFATWARKLLVLSDRKARGDLPRLALSVAASWEFDLPHIAGSWDLAEAMRVWGRTAPPMPRPAGLHGDPAGSGTLAIDATGDVYPSVLCLGEATARCGNVRTTPLHDIWVRSGILSRLRRLRVSEAAPECATCVLEERCGGGSRGRALALGGSILGPDVACPLVEDGRPAGGRPVSIVLEPPSRRRRGDAVEDGPRTHAVVGTGRTAVRLIEYPTGWELRTTWAVREITSDEAAAVVGYAARPTSPAPGCLRGITGLDRRSVTRAS